MVSVDSRWRHRLAGDRAALRGLRGWAAAIFAVVSIVAMGCGQEPPQNVLVVVADTVRADHLSINGYARETSPHLDALAREGTNFSQAVTVAPRTWQSITSMLTGLYPPRHGVRHIYDDPLAEELPTLASALGERGYLTATFDPGPFLKQMTGGAGFDLQRIAAQETAPSDAATMELLSDWIHREASEPFLALVRLQGAHWPYKDGGRPTPFEDCEGRDHAFNHGALGLRKEPGEGFVLEDEDAHRRFMWSTDLAPETLAHMIAHYDAEIRVVDGLVGALVERMRASGLLERTILIVLSDHGESFGEAGYLQHGPRVDEAVMRIPLVIRLPRSHPASRPGLDVPGLVRTVDLFPTVLDALGLSAPPGLDGISLLPAMAGDPLPELWAYGESGRSFVGLDAERAFAGVKGKQRMIRTSRWKLLASLGPEGWRYRLHDLRTDPGEVRDVAAEEPAVLERLRAHLETVLAAEPPEADASQLTAEELEGLRELGYVE